MEIWIWGIPGKGHCFSQEAHPLGTKHVFSSSEGPNHNTTKTKFDMYWDHTGQILCISLLTHSIGMHVLFS